jgi:hypothetical protein
MRLRCVLALITVSLFATHAGADVGLNTDQKSGLQIPLSQGMQKASSLIDLKKLSFNHTLGMTYGSGQGGGLSQYYLNDITYQISKPLIVKAQVGFSNNLSAATRYGSSSGVQIIVPSVSLLYQPKPNLRIEFGFSNIPNAYGRPNYGFYSPY